MKAIYVRVSTADQVKGYSLGNQMDKCVEKAGTLDVLQYKEEGRTGEIIDRPQLNQLREDIRNGIVTEVICYDSTRLSRNLLVQLMIKEEFDKAGVKLTFVNTEYADNAEGELQFNISGSISQYEKAKIKERTVGGKIRKVKEGKVLGAYGLYGYDYDQKESTYVINEEQAKIVKMIFDNFTDPTSEFRGINGIAKHLTELGIPTARGKNIWHRQVVRQMLLNESYTGRHAQRKHDTEGGYVRQQSGLQRGQKLRPKEEWIYTEIPQIISDEQFEIAQQKISKTKRQHAKESLRPYLLSGIMRCADCQNTMTGRVTSWWGSKVVEYTDIKNYSGAKFKGCGNSIRAEKIEEIVWEKVLEMLNEPEKAIKSKSDSKTKIKQEELLLVENQLEKIKKSRKRLISLAAMSDEVDLAEIKDQLASLKQNENDLQSKYNRLIEDIKESEVDRTEAKLKEALGLYFLEKKQDPPFEIKQKIIRALVDEVLVSKAGDWVEIHI
ncbi:recombinase family protein [Rossellomorea marisflavi]|uniref:recombinase family protein n=1 Tax=Rossellomorea marisflavi TaxID=189381 RepID=UPI00345DFB89